MGDMSIAVEAAEAVDSRPPLPLLVRRSCGAKGSPPAVGGRPARSKGTPKGLKQSHACQKQRTASSVLYGAGDHEPVEGGTLHWCQPTA